MRKYKVVKKFYRIDALGEKEYEYVLYVKSYFLFIPYWDKLYSSFILNWTMAELKKNQAEDKASKSGSKVLYQDK
jgi:hypothetical protein